MCVFVRVQNELFDGDRLAHFFIPLTLASVFRPTALSTASSMLPPVRGRCSYIAMTCQLPKNISDATIRMVFHIQIQHDVSVNLAKPYFLWDKTAADQSGFPMQFPRGFQGFPGVSRGFRQGMKAETSILFFTERGFLRTS